MLLHKLFAGRKLKAPQSEGPLVLEVFNYFFRINFCRAWICLLIDAIKATIDFRISALDTSVEPVVTLYEGVCVVPATSDAYATVPIYEPAVSPVDVPTE